MYTNRRNPKRFSNISNKNNGKNKNAKAKWITSQFGMLANFFPEQLQLDWLQKRLLPSISNGYRADDTKAHDPGSYRYYAQASS